MRDTALPRWAAKADSSSRRNYTVTRQRRAKGYRKAMKRKRSRGGDCRKRGTREAPHHHIGWARGRRCEVLVKNAQPQIELASPTKAHSTKKLGASSPAQKTVELRLGSEPANTSKKNGQTTKTLRTFSARSSAECKAPIISAARSTYSATWMNFRSAIHNRSGVGIGDVARAELIAKGAEGKRLTYRRPHIAQVN